MTVRFSGVVRAGAINPDVLPRYQYTAGEDIGAYMAVAKGESDGKIYLAQASDSTRMPAVGVTLTAVTAGNKVNIVDRGPISSIQRTEDFGQDDAVYVSATAGKVTKTVPAAVGNFVQILGRSTGASSVLLNVSEAMVRLDQV